MISSDHKETYVGLFVLKLLDLDPKDGGVEFPVNLPHDLYPFEPVLEMLATQGLVQIDRRKARYVLTQAGIDFLGTHIEEAESYIDELDELETDEVVRRLERRKIDPMRVRFLWGWYQGEFDDPVLFQQRRGMTPVERDWASFVQSERFFEELARDL